jgi:predicted lipopolysaccharide heptosyltransferase III
VNILLVRLRLIGDVVFTTPAIRAIRRTYPDASISYIVEEESAPVVEHNPHLDHVIVACSPHASGRLRADLDLVRRLRLSRYDLAIDFHGGPRASLLTWLSGARTRVGYEVTGRSWMYTHRVARPRALRPRHSVETQWDLLLALGIAPPNRETDPCEMPADPLAVERVARRLADLRVDQAAPIVVIHVSAGNPFRRWPVEAFSDLVVRLVRADACRRVILTSGPSEREAARRVANLARQQLPQAQQTALLDAGEFNLPELRALLDRAALYIGGDSGPLHVAGTTGVPVVALYGPTLPVRSAPWRSAAFISEAAETSPLPCRPCNQRRCEPGDFRCLTRISAESVAALAERALAAGLKQRHTAFLNPAIG